MAASSTKSSLTRRKGTQLAWVQTSHHDADFIAACFAQAPLFRELLKAAPEGPQDLSAPDPETETGSGGAAVIIARQRPAEGPQGWQPIATCPRMQTVLLFAFTENGANWKMASGFWHTGYEDDASAGGGFTPWHWTATN